MLPRASAGSPAVPDRGPTQRRPGRERRQRPGTRGSRRPARSASRSPRPQPDQRPETPAAGRAAARPRGAARSSTSASQSSCSAIGRIESVTRPIRSASCGRASAAAERHRSRASRVTARAGARDSGAAASGRAAAGAGRLGGDHAAQAELAQVQRVALDRQRQRPAAELAGVEGACHQHDPGKPEQGCEPAGAAQDRQPPRTGARPPCRGRRLSPAGELAVDGEHLAHQPALVELLEPGGGPVAAFLDQPAGRAHARRPAPPACRRR